MNNRSQLGHQQNGVQLAMSENMRQPSSYPITKEWTSDSKNRSVGKSRKDIFATWNPTIFTGIPELAITQNLFFYVFFPRNMASHTHPNFGSNWIQGDPGILPINNQMAAGWSQISTVDLLWNFTHCTKNLRASQASNEDLSSPQKGLTSKTTWMILDEHPTQ